MDDKVIVSNRSALQSKYGTRGRERIEAAIRALVKGDEARGIRGRLVWLDDAVAMRRFKGRPVVDRRDARQNKQAIDAICERTEPDYVLILGSTDVIPHQDLLNPVFSPPDDPDRTAPGDLPYACSTPYGRDVARFKGPTRVVGRLPDLTGGSEPSHLLRLLRVSARHRSGTPGDYDSYFGLSTASWHASTRESLTNLFRDAARMRVSPPAGRRHPSARLAARIHFVNCHGALSDPAFYGEDADNADHQPIALTSDLLDARITPGTVAAMECCYGAELYDSVMLALPLPICQQYLSQGAYGYFGSTTIAYGPAEGNGAADLITQYFLQAVKEGASLGRAALVARQRFVQQAAELDPVDLKTLAQFNLLGDPSVLPVTAPGPTALPRGVSVQEAGRQARRVNRAKLREIGELLSRNMPTASIRSRRGAADPAVGEALANIARAARIGAHTRFVTYDVRAPAVRAVGSGKPGVFASRYHVAVSRGAATDASAGRAVAVVAKEAGGRIVGYRIYAAK